MNLLTHIISASLLIIPLQAAAIIDIEKSRKDDGNITTKSVVGVSLSGKDGNSNTIDLATNYQLYWGEKNEENLLLAEQSYAETNGERSSKDFMIHLRKILHLDKKNAFEYYGQFQEDDVRGLKERGLIGANIRLKRFIMKDTFSNYFGIGAFYFKQSYTDPLKNGDKSYQGLRANLYWSHKRTIDNTSDLSFTVYVQPKLNEMDDIDVLAHSTLTTPLTEEISLTVSVKYSLLDASPVGFEQDELRYHTGLTYTF